MRRILVPMLIGVQLVACPAVGQAREASDAPGCGRLVSVAREAMREALRSQSVPQPVPWLDDDRVWAAEPDPAVR